MSLLLSKSLLRPAHASRSGNVFGQRRQMSMSQSSKNGLLGLALAAFSFGVFAYTVRRIKFVDQLGPEFDEKLKKPCDTCEEKKKSESPSAA